MGQPFSAPAAMRGFNSAAATLLSSALSFAAIFSYIRWVNKQSEVEVLTDQKRNYEQILSLLFGNMRMHYTYADRQLEDIVLTNKSKEEIWLSDLLKEGDALVFKFSSSNCSTCIQSGFTDLKQIAKNIPQERLIVLADKSNKREIQALSNSMNLVYPIYLVNDTAFSYILRDENVPFVFVIGEDLRMKDLFIPMKELPDYSDTYYRIVWKKYFQ